MRGRGCTSIYPAIHFIPLRGLDYSGETKVIRIHVIPKNTAEKKKKSLQTAEPSFPPRRRRMLIHENLPPNFPLCSLTSFLMHLWSSPLRASDPGQLVSNSVFIDGQQCTSTAAFVLKFPLNLPNLIYFPTLLSSSPPPSSKSSLSSGGNVSCQHISVPSNFFFSFPLSFCSVTHVPVPTCGDAALPSTILRKEKKKYLGCEQAKRKQRVKGVN